MVRTESLTVSYDGSHGVFDFDLELRRGESLALIGPSGCGKTTLLHGIAGLLKADRGRISLGGGQLSLVQQKDALFPWLSVGGNVRLAAGSDVTPGEVEDLLDALGLEGCRDRYPDQLSVGQRQRVSIARALITRPEILLLDEPSAALDAISREKLQDLLLELQLSYGMTSLLVTHSIEEALFLGSRVGVMVEGRLVETAANPGYPDPRARRTAGFYREVLKVREILDRQIASEGSVRTVTVLAERENRGEDET